MRRGQMLLAVCSVAAATACGKIMNDDAAAPHLDEGGVSSPAGETERDDASEDAYATSAPDARPGWSAMGEPVVTSPALTAPSIRVGPDGTVLVAFGSHAPGHPPHAEVDRWDNGAWSALGTIVPTSSLGCSSFVAFDGSGAPMVLLGYEDTGSSFVQRWSGTSWSALDASSADAGPLADLFSCPRFAVGATGLVGVVYTVIGDPFVPRFRELGPNAAEIAPLGGSPRAEGLGVAIDQADRMTVARGAAGSIQLDRWSGSVWESVAPPFVDTANTDGSPPPRLAGMSLSARADGTMIVVYERMESTLRQEPRTIVWTDGAWRALPVPKISANERFNGHAVLAIDKSGAPWLAYDTTPRTDAGYDPNAPLILHVARWDGASGEWSVVGGPVNTSAQRIESGFYDFTLGPDDVPYVAMLVASAQAGADDIAVVRYAP